MLSRRTLLIAVFATGIFFGVAHLTRPTLDPNVLEIGTFEEFYESAHSMEGRVFFIDIPAITKDGRMVRVDGFAEIDWEYLILNWDEFPNKDQLTRKQLKEACDAVIMEHVKVIMKSQTTNVWKGVALVNAEMTLHPTNYVYKLVFQSVRNEPEPKEHRGKVA